MESKVSVIVPFYNSERYIRESIESLLNQTLTDLEIICIDDGSTDKSCSIVLEYKNKDSRIKLVSKPNKGYGHSMNLGMSLANGEYVGILESDDYVTLDMFERLYDIAKNNNLDFIKSDFSKFYRNNDIETNEIVRICEKNPLWYDKILNPSTSPELLDITMNTWTGIYKLDFIRKFNIRHNETPGASYQDNGFWFQTFCLAERVMFVNEVFYNVRRDNPHSSVKSTGKVYCVTEEYEFILEFLKERPEIYDRFIYMYHKKKYRGYLFTMDRIDDLYRKEFLKFINGEYSEIFPSGELSRDVFSSHEWAGLILLIKFPELYYKWKYAQSLGNRLLSIIKKIKDKLNF